MSGAANLAPSLLALGAAFCFAIGLSLTHYGLRTVPASDAGRNLSVAEKGRNRRANSSDPPETPQG
jgi:hypothetical protein